MQRIPRDGKQQNQNHCRVEKERAIALVFFVPVQAGIPSRDGLTVVFCSFDNPDRR